MLDSPNGIPGIYIGILTAVVLFAGAMLLAIVQEIAKDRLRKRIEEWCGHQTARWRKLSRPRRFFTVLALGLVAGLAPLTYIQFLNTRRHPPTVAVLAFENRGSPDKQMALEGSWDQFANGLESALRSVSRIKIEPIHARREDFKMIGSTSALAKLRSLDVHPTVMIETEAKPLKDQITLWQTASVVVGTTLKPVGATSSVSAPWDQYDVLALRQVAEVVDRIGGALDLTSDERDRVSAALLKRFGSANPEPGSLHAQPRGTTLMEFVHSMDEMLAPPIVTKKSKSAATAGAVLSGTVRGAQ